MPIRPIATLDPYEWHNPWDLIAEARSMQLAWEDREDWFYRDMRIAQNAAHENMYAIRRQNEKLMEALIDTTKGIPLPPIYGRTF